MNNYYMNNYNSWDQRAFIYTYIHTYYIHIYIYMYVYIYFFQDGEVKCTLHLREGECEGNIKLLLEKRRLWENLCASAQFWQQRKKEKKAGNKVWSNH